MPGIRSLLRNGDWLVRPVASELLVDHLQGAASADRPVSSLFQEFVSHVGSAITAGSKKIFSHSSTTYSHLCRCRRRRLFLPWDRMSTANAPSRLTLANRQNSLLSTGPKTPEGKAASSRNALKTGLTGRTVLLPGDDAEA